MTNLRERPRPSGEQRCPYCHEALDPERAAECDGCGTSHHHGCFAEHGGCSTFACRSEAAADARNVEPWSAEALRGAAAWGAQGGGLGNLAGQAEGFRVLRRGLRPDPTCGCCGEPWEGAAVVARCGCNLILHAECYERAGACPGAICQVAPRGVVLVTPAEARLRNRRDLGAGLRDLALIFGTPMALVLPFMLLDSSTKASLIALAAIWSLAFAVIGVCGEWFRRSNSGEGSAPSPPAEPTDKGGKPT